MKKFFALLLFLFICACNESVVGPTGPQGEPGIPGPGQRTVVSGTCDPSGNLVVYNSLIQLSDMPMIMIYIYGYPTADKWNWPAVSWTFSEGQLNVGPYAAMANKQYKVVFIK